jgi:hypothetical protein
VQQPRRAREKQRRPVHGSRRATHRRARDEEGRRRIAAARMLLRLWRGYGRRQRGKARSRSQRSVWLLADVSKERRVFHRRRTARLVHGNSAPAARRSRDK